MRDRSSKIGGDLGQVSDGTIESDGPFLVAESAGGSTVCALGGNERAIAAVESRALYSVTAKARTHSALYALGIIRVRHLGLPAVRLIDYK